MRDSLQWKEIACSCCTMQNDVRNCPNWMPCTVRCGVCRKTKLLKHMNFFSLSIFVCQLCVCVCVCCWGWIEVLNVKAWVSCVMLTIRECFFVFVFEFFFSPPRTVWMVCCYPPHFLSSFSINHCHFWVCTQLFKTQLSCRSVFNSYTAFTLNCITRWRSPECRSQAQKKKKMNQKDSIQKQQQQQQQKTGVTWVKVECNTFERFSS